MIFVPLEAQLVLIITMKFTYVLKRFDCIIIPLVRTQAPVPALPPRLLSTTQTLSSRNTNIYYYDTIIFYYYEMFFFPFSSESTR